MPTLGAHFSDDEEKIVENAASASAEKKVGPYIAEAVRQRMKREGMMPGDPIAELVAAAEELGSVETAVTVLRREKRKAKRAA